MVGPSDLRQSAFSGRAIDNLRSRLVVERAGQVLNRRGSADEKTPPNTIRWRFFRVPRRRGRDKIPYVCSIEAKATILGKRAYILTCANAVEKKKKREFCTCF